MFDSNPGEDFYFWRAEALTYCYDKIGEVPRNFGDRLESFYFRNWSPQAAVDAVLVLMRLSNDEPVLSKAGTSTN
jgi:hypothetical protein